jgi:plasmid maintenance system antidote protein VapI
MVHQGQLLQKKVKELNINTNDLAIFLDMSRQNIYNLFNRKQLDFEMIDRLCEYLKVSKSYFNETPKDFQKNDNENSNNSLIEELRATIEKLERDKEFLQSLVMQQFQLLSNKVEQVNTKLESLANAEPPVVKCKEIGESHKVTLVLAA